MNRTEPTRLPLLSPALATVLDVSDNSSNGYYIVHSIDLFGKRISYFYLDKKAARKRYLVERSRWPTSDAEEYITFESAVENAAPVVVAADQSQFYARLSVTEPSLRRDVLKPLSYCATADGSDCNVPYQIWVVAPTGISRSGYPSMAQSAALGEYRAAAGRLKRDRLETFVFAQPGGIVWAVGQREAGPYFAESKAVFEDRYSRMV